MRSRVELFEQSGVIAGLRVCRCGRWLNVMGCTDGRSVRRWCRPMPPKLARRVWQHRKISPFVAAIDEMLRAHLSAPRKQRHTVVRIVARLVEEHGAADLAYGTVRAYVAQRRPEIDAETGRPAAEVFIAQSHQPGAEAEVDFAEL